MQFRNHRADEVFLLKQERAIISLLSNSLRTAQVYVDSITVVLNKFSCLQKDIWVVSTELNCKWSILWTWFEILHSVFWFLGEKSGVKHWRVANLSLVLPCEHSVRQLTLVDHRRNKIFGTAYLFVVSIPIYLLLTIFGL